MNKILNKILLKGMQNKLTFSIIFYNLKMFNIFNNNFKHLYI